jgi:hypothetical protein
LTGTAVEPADAQVKRVVPRRRRHGKKADGDEWVPAWPRFRSAGPFPRRLARVEARAQALGLFAPIGWEIAFYAGSAVTITLS